MATQSLFELKENLSSVLEMLESIDENTSEEERSSIEDALKITVEDFNRKAENYVFAIKNLQANIESLKNFKKEFDSKIKTKENLVDYLKNRLIFAMDDLNKDKVKLDLFSLSIRNFESVEDLKLKEIISNCFLVKTEIEVIPEAVEEYGLSQEQVQEIKNNLNVESSLSISKTLIKNLWKEGKFLVGAFASVSKSLIIK